MPTASNGLCQCGQNANQIHCPSCGTTNVYVVRSLSTRRPDPDTGQMREYCGFRCRRCPRTFDDLDWRIDCQAAQKNAARQDAIPNITPTHHNVRSKDLPTINALRKRQGMPPLEDING